MYQILCQVIYIKSLILQDWCYKIEIQIYWVFALGWWISSRIPTQGCLILDPLFFLLYYALLVFSINCLCPLAWNRVLVCKGVSCWLILELSSCLGEWLQCPSPQATFLPCLDLVSGSDINEETFWQPVEQNRSSKSLLWKNIFPTSKTNQQSYVSERDTRRISFSKYKEYQLLDFIDWP